jgi:hypothetical protein
MTAVREKRGTLLRGLGGCALALALLAGCSEKPQPRETDDFAAENVVEAPPLAPPPPVVQAPVEKPPEPAENTADALPPEEPMAPDEQMLEDADAAGLTARTATPPDVVSEPSADPVAEPASGGLDSGVGN